MSINRGVLICDECCSVHRSLGRHISQVGHLKLAPWNPSLLSVSTITYNMIKRKIFRLPEKWIRHKELGIDEIVVSMHNLNLNTVDSI